MKLTGAAVSFEFRREARCGRYAAVVRAAKAGRDGRVRTLTVQLAGGDPAARTLSARFRGERVKLERAELETVRVRFRGNWHTLADLANEGGRP